MSSRKIDDLDLKILNQLMKNANQPYTELAKKLFVSGGTIHVRMNKLLEMGIVEGASLRVNHELLGYDVTAFLGLYLDKSSMYDEVVEELKKILCVVDVHYTTGQYSLFAKIICRDTKHLREILHEKIQQIEGIQRTETFISLQESLSRPLNLFDPVSDRE